MNIVPRKSFFDVDRFFNDWFGDTDSNFETPVVFSPRVDIREKKDQYVITADLPGVAKNDIKVSLDNGILTLEATTKDESNEEKDGKVVRRERRFGSYLRRFDLGENVQESDINAEFKDGVLTLFAPKVELTKAEVKSIEIR